MSSTTKEEPAELRTELESKSDTIEALEVELSNTRAKMKEQSSTNSAHEEQIAALESKLASTEASLERSQNELEDTKRSLTRLSEKAMKEGVEKTSTDTLIKNFQRDLEQAQAAKADADKKADGLDKKLQTQTNLHRELETRNQSRQQESQRTTHELGLLKRKLVTVENENLRLRDERDRLRRRDEPAHAGAAGDGDDDALDELEDEARARLERRVRELEGEVFDLKRGLWQEKRREMQPDMPGSEAATTAAPPRPGSASVGDTAFDDVDLIGGPPVASSHHHHHHHHPHHHQPQQQQHSTLSTVLSSGLAAFTGTPTPLDQRRRASSAATRQARQRSLGQANKDGAGAAASSSGSGAGQNGESDRPAADDVYVDYDDDDDDDDADSQFDEAAFALAQKEEEDRRRVEWTREVKARLPQWKGWRLDLVDERFAFGGVGGRFGDVFEV